MSEAAKTHSGPSALSKPVPNWIGAGLIGVVLGAGSTLIVIKANAKSLAISENGAVSMAPSKGGPPGMGSGGMGGGMGMMMGMGGGGGAGGGARGKRNLTLLVGKLELLTRGSLHVQLTPEQTAKFADQLAKLDQTEKMTADEAQTQLETLEALLTPEQKAIADSISLPFGRPGGGGGPGGPGGGGPGGIGRGGPGGGPPGAGGMGPGAPGAADDENPFRQEVNQKRLHDLLGRIDPASSLPAKTEPATGEPATGEPAKSEPAK